MAGCSRKEVLCCFGNHKRSVTYDSSSGLNGLLGAVSMMFQDVLGSASSCDMFVQVKDERWNEYVDVLNEEEIENNSVVNIVVHNSVSSQKECGDQVKHKVFSRGESLSKTLSTPSGSEAKELSRLFPHSSNSKRTHFDPHQQLPGLPDKKKKKQCSTSMGRIVKVSICRLESLTPSIPKGKVRKDLKDSGRCVDIQLTRSMSPVIVKNVIDRAFHALSKSWLYLESGQDNGLSVAKNQSPDGQILCSRRGYIYIVDEVQENVTPQACSQPQLESQSPPIVTNEISSSDEQCKNERRTIIALQDQALEESLLSDKRKDSEKAEKARQKRVREDLQLKLQRTYATACLEEKDTICICFRFPNGDRKMHNFCIKSEVKDLYGYIYSTGFVGDCFTLCVHPKRVLPLSDIISSDMGVIVIEERDDSPDVFDLFSATVNEQSDEETAVSVMTPGSDSVLCEKANEGRVKFLTSFGLKSGVTHSIRRMHIFKDVIELYSNKNGAVAREYPFFVEFRGEIAVDAGGPKRDMFTAFFEEMYIQLFDGSSLFHPAVHASVNVRDFCVVGTILSHAFLIEGIIPDRIVFPCLAAVFLGPSTSIPDAILNESFVTSLCCHDQGVIQRAMDTTLSGEQIEKEYPDSLQQDLIALLSCHGCRQVPTVSNLMSLINKAARYTFLIKPAAALQMLTLGVPEEHKLFWRDMNVEMLWAVYKSVCVSTSKVLDLLEEPFMTSLSQENVWVYLRRFIGSLTTNELRSFMRFVTGSCVVCVPRITVTFNCTEGLGRRPVSHTCSATLELSSTYSSLPQFAVEFRAVLSDSQYAWRMDSL